MIGANPMKSYKMKLIEYSVFGNKSEGYEVNDLHTLMDDLIYLGDIDNLSDKEIVKIFHNQKHFGLFGTDLIKMDFRKISIFYSSDFFIEIWNKSGLKPIGRVEWIEL